MRKITPAVKAIAVVPAVVIAAALGLWLYSADRTAGDTGHWAGSHAPDRVEVNASVLKVDAAAREAVLRVLVVPLGRFGEDDGVAPAGELRLLSSSSLRDDRVFPAHQRISSLDIPIALTGGAVTDYPFDGYEARIEFAAVHNGEPAPVLFTLDKVDSLFSFSVKDYRATEDQGGLDVRFSRSTSVLVFALFMMITMWGLAIAVFFGARHLIARRRGLVWPSFGFMAATLFALAGFRNLAPGSPPIGSLLDYTAFLWAEVVIALCVVVSVVTGAITEQGKPDS
ncbi:DUF4436 domain-containing protein [Amycolatopsis thailandensis]|uniref:DUF4436 domain-containing protein n=1 Tax=Amycolatopsis thailandensis TaxID=589330 RepID=A0A229S5C1_9PSEU|nr:DUF4436 family protein [Amycolatopsis thailandensis]OXM53804.1 DUF4436 domain-containing protein [Amycolatopsis thailandensis]